MSNPRTGTTLNPRSFFVVLLRFDSMAVALLRSRIHGRILRPYSTQPSLLWSPAADDPHSPASTLQIFSWGHGGSGQLGGGKEELRHYPTSLAALRLPPDFRLSPVPGRVPFPPPPTGSMEVGISCGLFHSALLVNGMLWIWGKGDGGRLGFGDEVSVFVPKLNPNLSDVKSVALGGIHSTALTASGDVFTWSVRCRCFDVSSCFLCLFI